MEKSSKPLRPYGICVLDVGSPKLGNLGWCFIEAGTNIKIQGTDLDDLIPHIARHLQKYGMILGLEAPLFIPLRKDLMLATKARKGEGRRPWSAGAGAQVLAINLPVMIYLFEKIRDTFPEVKFFIDPDTYDASPGQILVFEALVSGADKGNSHIQDAEIMASYCLWYAQRGALPPSILENEEEVRFFNLAGAALLHTHLSEDINCLTSKSAIYKPGGTIGA